jgi:hypothetical protein
VAQDSPGDAGPAFTVTDLLNAVPEYAVAGLLGQVRLASDALDSLRAKHASSDVWDDPTFAGSADVGGADADLIVGDLLIDVREQPRRHGWGRRSSTSFWGTRCWTTTTNTESSGSASTCRGSAGW